MRLLTTAIGLLLFGSLAAQAQTLDRAACAKLGSLNLQQAALTAELVGPGAFTAPAEPGGVSGPPQMFAALPAFCRVTGTLTPSADSSIRVDLWLPASGWNGKLEGVGNGGWAGSIFYFLMADGLGRGYAVVSTDTGHAGDMGDGSFAFNHPEKLTDFAYRAVHEMTVVAKTVVVAAYGNGPRLSYWNGCSTGGLQGLKEAQKYPADYDAVLAGAPANYMTHLMIQTLWVGRATLVDPASKLSPQQFTALHDAAIAECDALDGVKDGILRDPTACRFDPASLACSGGETAACLTPPQVDAARKIYGGVKNPRTGAAIFPGLERTSEKGWDELAGGPAPFSIAADYFKYIIYKTPDWDYHGWTDPFIAPRNTIDYFASVVNAIGAGAASQSMRLFMAPGMDHCIGGEGPSEFDGLAALERWVEQKQAPERIVATHMSNGKPDRTRPLCPHPQVAVYSGTGSTDDEANFVCK